MGGSPLDPSRRRALAKGMRALFLCLMLVPSLAALAGCSSLVRKDGDFFEASGVPPDQFERDDENCRLQASN
jgi:hypothetical protein